jgi:hypothetical protein
LHLGVILSGVTTFFSTFFAGPPVSFYLAQCALAILSESASGRVWVGFDSIRGLGMVLGVMDGKPKAYQRVWDKWGGRLKKK